MSQSFPLIVTAPCATPAPTCTASIAAEPRIRSFQSVCETHRVAQAGQPPCSEQVAGKHQHAGVIERRLQARAAGGCPARLLRLGRRNRSGRASHRKQHPAAGSPCSSRPMQTAKLPRPAMKLFVPSIGSMTQTRRPGLGHSKVIASPVSFSSPIMPSPGNRRFRPATM